MLHWNDVAVVVSDGKEAARFWKEKLDFEVRSQDGHWVTVAPRGANVVLHLCGSTAREPVDPGNTGIGFDAPDVAKVEEQLRARGVRITTPTTKAAWGTFMMFADPDGNEFWVSEA